jgi:hypothetical protein
VSQSLSELHALTHEGWQVPCPPESTAPELASELSLGLASAPSLDPLSLRLPDPESLSTDASVPPSRNIGPKWASVDPPHAIATSDSKATAGATARRMPDDAPVMGTKSCLGAMRSSLAPSHLAEGRRFRRVRRRPSSDSLGHGSRSIRRTSRNRRRASISLLDEVHRRPARRPEVRE